MRTTPDTSDRRLAEWLRLAEQIYLAKPKCGKIRLVGYTHNDSLIDAKIDISEKRKLLAVVS